jgi:hypothetical protein
MMASDLKSIEREKVVAIANSFAPLLDDPNLSEKDIDSLIEELRPLRMKIRALDDGSAPGFRNYDRDDEKITVRRRKQDE